MSQEFIENLWECARIHAVAEAYDRERLVHLRSSLDAVQAHPLLPGDFDVRLFTDDVLRVNVREEVGRFLFVFKAYELGLSRFLCEHLRPGMTAFDVGAHIGYFSVLMARLVGQTACVAAFEPTPATAAYLRHNTSNVPWVRVEETLVGDREGFAAFNDFGAGHSAFNSLSAARTSDGALVPLRRLQLPMTTLDGYCKRHGFWPDLVKIDVESSEVLVLRGMEEVLTRRPTVILEVGDFEHLAGQAALSADLLRLMRAKGYELFEPGLEGLSPHHIQDGPYTYANIVCLPCGRPHVMSG